MTMPFLVRPPKDCKSFGFGKANVHYNNHLDQLLARLLGTPRHQLAQRHQIVRRDLRPPSGQFVVVVVMTDTFEEACKKADEKARVDQALGQTQADDWLSTIAKKSQEALAAKAAKQQVPAPNKDEVVDALARKDTVEYDQVRGAVSETLGIRIGTLDELVTARRETIAAASDDHNPAHWAVVPSADPVDGAALLDNIRAVFRRYIMLPPWADIALPLWVMHAWTHDRCEISPILCLTSPTMRCGKSSVMIILTYLTPRSELASNISKASIYRHITAVHPTLLIDEGDTFLTGDDEMRGILNSGHMKAGANVVRQVEEHGEIVSRRFSTWAPKAIALIKRLADTLTDRSIIILLTRKPKAVSVERLR
jgi:hypothetical protein